MTIHDLTIEQMREIVAGAPDNTALHYSSEDGDLVYFRDGDYYDNDYGDWFEIYFMMPDLISLDTLRTAITEHDKAWLEKRFGIKKWYPIPEHHMCVDKRLADMTDDCTDIRNHLSPSTKVIELEALGLNGVGL